MDLRRIRPHRPERYLTLSGHTTRSVMQSLTPTVIVEAIEPVLPFWVDRLGFAVTDKVSEGDRLGFVILKNGRVEVMYQTLESIRNDVPELADMPLQGSALFVKVGTLEKLDAVDEALSGVDRVVPRRRTFYGADEIIVRDPAGNVVTFAYFAKS